MLACTLECHNVSALNTMIKLVYSVRQPPFNYATTDGDIQNNCRASIEPQSHHFSFRSNCLTTGLRACFGGKDPYLKAGWYRWSDACQHCCLSGQNPTHGHIAQKSPSPWCTPCPHISHVSSHFPCLHISAIVLRYSLHHITLANKEITGVYASYVHACCSFPWKKRSNWYFLLIDQSDMLSALM